MKMNIIILLFLNFFYVILTWRCGADQLKIKPGILNITKEEKKRRLSSYYTPIKIKADYSNLKMTDSINSGTLQKIKNLIDETCNEFSKFLKVQHINVGLFNNEEFIKEQCEIDSLGADFGNYLIENDVIIFPSFDSELGGGVLAAAGLCLYNAENLRPFGGMLLINPELSFSKKNTDLYMKNLLFHELTHVLVFNPELMKELGMTNTKIFDGSFVTFVNSPRVLTAARQHFNCTTLNGIPLENQGSEGSAGSHWEARYMLSDYMISTDYIDAVLSDITLALFEDSGFYKVEYYSGGLFKYGKNMGCSFFEKKCIENANTDFKNEFCININEDFCSRTRAVKGQCLIYHHTDSIPSRYQYFEDKKNGGFKPANYCPVSNIEDSDRDYYPTSCHAGTSYLNSDYGEKISDSSFCFISSLLPYNSSQSSKNQAICYQVECDKNNKQIIVNIGNNKVICPSEGGTITNPNGFSGKIDCPEYNEICGFDSEDNSICNEMFDCIKKGIETDVNTFSYFPDEDDDFNKIVIKTISEKFKINFTLIFLLLLFYI